MPKALTRAGTARAHPRSPYDTFLRRLRAGGRSNMYGAIPYLMERFGLDREAAFRVVCEWVDQQETSAPAHSRPAARARSA